MKKVFIATVLLSAFTISCKKSVERPKDAVSEDSLTKAAATSEEVISYRASDGSRANVTLVSGPKENTMLIKANNSKFLLDRKSPTRYERNGIEAEIKGDSLFITQDNSIISLVKDH